MSKSVEAFSRAVDISTKNPALFAPALAPIAISFLFSALAFAISLISYRPFLAGSVRFVGDIIAMIAGFAALCVVIDMASGLLSGSSADLRRSSGSALGRLGCLLVTAIIAALIAFTIILIPLALFMVAIAVVEKENAVQSIKDSLEFVVKNLGEVAVFLIIVIAVSIIIGVLGIILSLIPLMGPLMAIIISWAANVVFAVAAAGLYLSLRARRSSSSAASQPPT